ncbi:hypothetical protein F0U44_11180 [Nocardioides humilatus]|uniref:Fibronectin type-III domain-containing protein n=1 Tax=Nocardioides humilatus TaxID=2607660 RepID=A0A5B1LFR5_9ACTN|nr:hypothetical protein [Nocardioides humilatus]KAA1419018.1 hypothetical protein F0U44_11180 [Nocardioides humilatus]
MKRSTGSALTAWLGALGVVLALFLAPSSSGVAARSSLTVVPGSGAYGGQQVTWSGSIGVGGVQQIHLQRRGSPTSDWADVRDSTFTTEPDGSFSFVFPAPAMNGVHFRVVSDAGATPAYLFKTQHQDADLTISEATPRPSDVALPRGFAVTGERYRIAVDTKRGAAGILKPILGGREITLLFHGSGTDEWTEVDSARIGLDGLASFGPYGPGDSPQVPGFYRVVLGEWTQDGDQIGWFPSLPLYLRVVDRPRPVTNLAAAPESHRVVLTWTLSADPRRANIVIARRAGLLAPQPTAAEPSAIVATLPASTDRYTDLDIVARKTYNYAVYSVTADGIYTAAEARIETTTPLQRGR